MKKSLRVSVVIPNWNGADLLAKNLPKVLVATSEAVEIIVVDDLSSDNSVKLIKENFPAIRLIRKREHQGFASSVNLGVEAAKGDIVVLLNTDIKPEPGFLPPLLSHFKNPDVFAVGCMDKSIEDGNVVLRGRGEAAWRKGFYVHWRGDVDRSDTAWVSCGSGAFRKDIWKKLGGLDTTYNPFYWEDIDISYRAARAGYALVFEPKSIVDHYHEEGMVRRQYLPEQVQTISYRNQFVFIWKNFSSISTLIRHIFWTPIRLVQALLKGDYPMIAGFIQAVFLLPKIVINRSVVATYDRHKKISTQ